VTEQDIHVEGGEEPVTINEKRRIDPETGEVRAAGGFFSSPFGRKSDTADAPEPDLDLPAVEQSEADLALQESKQEAAERTADLQRVSAEYANYRKRVERDRDLSAKAATTKVLTEMLTVMDDIDNADRHGDLTGAFKAVADRLMGVLTKAGLAQFGAVGDEFDPALHEAVQFATSSEVTAQTVTTVMRHGYSMGDRLARAAVVGVTGPEEGSEGSAQEPVETEAVEDEAINVEIVEESHQ